MGGGFVRTFGVGCGFARADWVGRRTPRSSEEVVAAATQTPIHRQPDRNWRHRRPNCVFGLSICGSSAVERQFVPFTHHGRPEANPRFDNHSPVAGRSAPGQSESRPPGPATTRRRRWPFCSWAVGEPAARPGHHPPVVAGRSAPGQSESRPPGLTTTRPSSLAFVLCAAVLPTAAPSPPLLRPVPTAPPPPRQDGRRAERRRDGGGAGDPVP